ncbi:MAG TPA: ABC transporter ATP-binding protein [Mycobacteriales bacterium]|nr:ABC transporter ATP-binding protein [Mycobacteriales bacterium]
MIWRFLAPHRAHTQLLWRVAPQWAAIGMACALLTSSCLVVSMFAVGRLVGAAYRVVTGPGDTGAAWTWFVVFAAVTLLDQWVQAVARWSGPRLWAAYRLHLHDLIAEAGLHPRGLAELDSEKTAGALRSVTQNSRHWMIPQGLTGTWTQLQTRLVGIGSLIVLISWRWWVPLLVAASFALTSRAVSRWIDGIHEYIWSDWPVERRHGGYALRLLVEQSAAKEVRLFGLASWLADRAETLIAAANGPAWRAMNRRMRPIALAVVAMLVIVGGALVLLAYDAYHRRVGASGVTTYVLALLALQAFGMQTDTQPGLARVSGLLRDLGELRVGLGLPALTGGPAPKSQKAIGQQCDIAFDDVTFTYPSRNESTLRNLSLTIPAGQSVAVVGVNGAGKSTLVKLLAGLYEVDSGSIRIGGRDASEAQGLVAVVFQDFVHYPLSLRDNIGFGAIGLRDDDAVLGRALTDAGGADVLDRLDHGWDTVLTGAFTGGTDLSGGQWQRVALARALTAIRDGARILVLDEPTAAMDVRAESQLFNRFLDVAGEVTTILVSHRLSTVRRAERILVLDGAIGAITEDGSHEELMAHGGEYARMFTLQATRFAGDL